MLLEATINNCLSYNEPQTFSLMANSSDEHFNNNVAVVKVANHDYKALRCAVVYGANASGKSNLLNALHIMRSIVLDSATRQSDKLLPVAPFKLDSQSRNKPSEFELIFIADGVRYQYGFSANKELIIEEWLYAFPKGQAQLWFQRAWDFDKKQHAWKFGSSLLGEKLLWLRSTHNNNLFLTTAALLKSEQLQPVFDWFKNKFNFVSAKQPHPQTTIELINNGQKQGVLNYLQAAGFPVFDIVVKQPDTDAALKQQAWDVEIQYLDDENKPVGLNLKDESQGLQHAFNLIGLWIKALSQGQVLFVDDLDNNLHPNLVRFLIKLFNCTVTNPHGAQLVFSTHDTNQLNQEVFRRDQIWFCEAGKDKATKLYPLTDFSPRKGRDNLEVLYLSGRFGALPFINDLKTLN